MNETLEAMARAIFKDWFVDCGPTRAKMEGRTPYLAPDLWSNFPQRLDADGKPEGWERISLREAAEVSSGGTPAKENSEYWNGDIPWISPKVMKGIHVSNSDDRVTTAAIGYGTRLASRGSVLVMVRGMGLHQGVRISQARRDGLSIRM
jgi:type I restriction enzyme S subunit